MAALQTITLEHIPAMRDVHVALFRNLRNAAALQANLLRRDPEFEYAFIDASAIVSRAHLLSAIFRALVALDAGTLRTPNVHSEIVVSLARSNNISEAYRRFGINPPSTNSLIVVKITNTPDETALPSAAARIRDHLTRHIDADPVPLTDENFAAAADWDRARKYYKLTGLAWLDALPEERRRAEEEMLVLVAMALRGV